jgi:hypothetical protein
MRQRKGALIDLARDREPAQGVACLSFHTVTGGRKPRAMQAEWKTRYCEHLLPFIMLMKTESYKLCDCAFYAR